MDIISKIFRKLFGIHKPNKAVDVGDVYQETDTKCDKCDLKDECDLLEITTSSDTRRHYISGLGNVCKKEVTTHTVKEYCELHNCTKNKVYKMIKRGDVNAKKNSRGAWIIYE